MNKLPETCLCDIFSNKEMAPTEELAWALITAKGNQEWIFTLQTSNTILLYLCATE